MAGEVTGSLGDVDGEIAHSLQVVVDLHDTNHKTKIRGHGLVQGENLQALFFDLHFLLINGEVQFMDTGRKFCISLLKCGDRLVGDFFHQTAHIEQLAFDGFKVSL